MNLKRSLIIAILFLAPSCESNSAAPEVESPESVIVTLWPNQFELFMEYPPLRVGESASFAAHLTHLGSFEPVTDGPVRFRFSKQGTLSGEKVLQVPLRPGLYVPEFTFDSPGEYSLSIVIESPKGTGAIQVESLLVFGANAELPQPADIPILGDSVSYLKEQQWKLPFRTELARTQNVRKSISVSGRVGADPASDFLVLPPLSGHFTAPPRGIPVLGEKVRKGQLLGFVEPPLPAPEQAALVSNQTQTQAALAQLQEKISDGESRITELEARLELAGLEKDRAERLVEIQAIPQKRLESTTREVKIIEAKLAATRRNLSSLVETVRGLESQRRPEQRDHRIAIYAPGAGTVVDFRAASGAFVEQNEVLFRVIDLASVWIRANVPENQIHELDELGASLISFGGSELNLSPENSRLVGVGDLVDVETRTIPIIWSVTNDGRDLRIGMRVEVEVFGRDAIVSLVAPRSALLREENKTIVYVHVSGETFDRRIVETGMADGAVVQILKGLSVGERIVIEGAYEVSLASRSAGLPAGEGHVH